MKIFDNLLKIYYKIPRYKMNFNIYRNDRDDRSFEWYECRKEYGFDERELWGLKQNMENFINTLYDFTQTEMNPYGELSGVVSYVTVYRDILNGDLSKITNFAKYAYPRIKAYRDWGCPMSVYLPESQTWMDGESVDGDIDLLIDALEEFLETGHYENSDVSTLCFYFKNFGW